MSQEAIVDFRLYVVGDASNSVLAIANLQELCRQYLPGRHRIEIVDMLSDPDRALVDDVLLSPTLLKLSPEPARKIIGNLSKLDVVLKELGLSSPAKARSSP